MRKYRELEDELEGWIRSSVKGEFIDLLFAGNASFLNSTKHEDFCVAVAPKLPYPIL